MSDIYIEYVLTPQPPWEGGNPSGRGATPQPPWEGGWYFLFNCKPVLGCDRVIIILQEMQRGAYMMSYHVLG